VDLSQLDEDEHSHYVFFIQITYKVATGYTPYQLYYILHPLMPIECVIPILNGDHKDIDHVRVFTNKLSNLEKLQIDRL
jgi:hypothetical protein